MKTITSPAGLARAFGLVGLVLLVLTVQPCFAADSFVLYQVGVKEVQSWSLAKDFFRAKGYDILYQLGETTIEKHLEKIGRTNRSPAKFLLALEFVTGEDASALVAMTGRKRAEGESSLEPGKPPATRNGKGPTTFVRDAETGSRFLAMDELPEKYASDSGKLASAIADSFSVKVKHVPLFPLLGADMPGIFLRLECKQDRVGEMLRLLNGGIQNYLRRDVPHER